MFKLEDLHYIPQAEVPYPATPALAEAQRDLTDDGDTFELADGRSLRLSISVDEDYSINDYDSDGSIEWTQPRRGDRYAPRPDNFDGNARIIMRDGSSCLWWQPPGKDIIGDTPWTAEQMRAEEFRIRELAEYGFKVVGLHLLEEVADSMGGTHKVEVAVAYLGGVDSMYPQIISELASDLMDKVAA